jgi:hypothetical protein
MNYFYGEEYSVSGPKYNPLGRYSYEQAINYANELDLPDSDFEFISQCFALNELEWDYPEGTI